MIICGYEIYGGDGILTSSPFLRHPGRDGVGHHSCWNWTPWVPSFFLSLFPSPSSEKKMAARAANASTVFLAASQHFGEGPDPYLPYWWNLSKRRCRVVRGLVPVLVPVLVFSLPSIVFPSLHVWIVLGLVVLGCTSVSGSHPRRGNRH